MAALLTITQTFDGYSNSELLAAFEALAALKALVAAIDFEGAEGRIRFNPGTAFETDELVAARAVIAKAEAA